MRQRNVMIPIMVFGLMVCIGIYLIDRDRQREGWRRQTTPLPLETVATLCANFDLGDKNPLCSGNRDVYAPDFFKVIRETFRPEIEQGWNPEEMTTYEDVEAKLGMFKIEREPLVTETNPRFVYFRCGYDLRGDRISLIGIYFRSPENTVYRIDTLVGRDD